MEAIASSGLVEHQIKQWQLAQRKQAGSPLTCIALSRLPGTPGAEIGAKVAKRLGYGFFGIELVDEIARVEHVRADLVAHLDEHVRSTLDRYLLDLFRHTDYGERDYLHSVGRTIKALASKGGAVILGRGAPFLLGTDQALRIQIIGGRDARLARLAAAKGSSPTEARTQLAAEEIDRLNFLRHFVAEPDSAEHFDLVINTDHRNVDYWVDLIVQALTLIPRAA